MRQMSKGASEILSIAGELARARGGSECSTKDLAFAVVVYRRLLADRELERVGETSSELVFMSASIEGVMTGGGGELAVSELVELAMTENPDLAEYLG